MPDYATTWFARAITRHDAVASVRTLANGHVEILRGDLPTVTIAPLSDDLVDQTLVREVLGDGAPTIILAVRRQAHYLWSARQYAEEHDSTVHTYTEMMSSLNESDPRPHVDRTVEFVTVRLHQHSRVVGIEMVCEASFKVIRRGLPTLTVAVAYEYEMTEEALVRAVGRHPDANIIYNANPNGRPTTAALAHGEFASVETYRFGDLMSRLNRG